VKTDCEALAEKQKAIDEMLKDPEKSDESGLFDKLGSK
jgi:uncharacterized protein YjgD (DUF1641 family)